MSTDDRVFLNRDEIDNILRNSKRSPGYCRTRTPGETERHIRVLYAMCSYLFDQVELLTDQLAAPAPNGKVEDPYGHLASAIVQEPPPPPA